MEFAIYLESPLQLSLKTDRGVLPKRPNYVRITAERQLPMATAFLKPEISTT